MEKSDRAVVGLKRIALDCRCTIVDYVTSGQKEQRNQNRNRLNYGVMKMRPVIRKNRKTTQRKFDSDFLRYSLEYWKKESEQHFLDGQFVSSENIKLRNKIARFKSDVENIAHTIRIMTFTCKSHDVFSCEFGNEFCEKVIELLKKELNGETNELE